MGARLVLVRGLISDCGKISTVLSRRLERSTSARSKSSCTGSRARRPWAELAEQCGWRLPDVIVYPTGGGTGLVGMWKAFQELETMGLIGPEGRGW